MVKAGPSRPGGIGETPPQARCKLGTIKLPKQGGKHFPLAKTLHKGIGRGGTQLKSKNREHP